MQIVATQSVASGSTQQFDIANRFRTGTPNTGGKTLRVALIALNLRLHRNKVASRPSLIQSLFTR